jgi:hypothetical protein
MKAVHGNKGRPNNLNLNLSAKPFANAFTTRPHLVLRFRFRHVSMFVRGLRYSIVLMLAGKDESWFVLHVHLMSNSMLRFGFVSFGRCMSHQKPFIDHGNNPTREVIPCWVLDRDFVLRTTIFTSSGAPLHDMCRGHVTNDNSLLLERWMACAISQL